MENLLEIKNLTVKNNEDNELLRSINLALKKDTVNVLIGESGSGKSLTAQAIVQQLPPPLRMQFDELIYNQKPVHDISTKLGSEIGFITQDYTHSFNQHTKIGKQLIAIYRTHRNVDKATAVREIEQWLKSVELNPSQIMHRYRFNLSGGQLARVQISSVLMLKPSLIIADEPTASLDVINGVQVMNLIKQLAENHGVTLLLITHNLSQVLNFCDWINVIQHGTIVDTNHITAFKKGHIHPYSAQLFNARSQLRKGDAYD